MMIMCARLLLLIFLILASARVSAMEYRWQEASTKLGEVQASAAMRGVSIDEYIADKNEAKSSILGWLRAELTERSREKGKSGSYEEEERDDYFIRLFSAAAGIRTSESLDLLLEPGVFRSGNIALTAISGFGAMAINPLSQRYLSTDSEIDHVAVMICFRNILSQEYALASYTAGAPIYDLALQSMRAKSPVERASAVRVLAYFQFNAEARQALTAASEQDRFWSAIAQEYPVREEAKRALHHGK
jgi:hypothetical protein